MEWDFEAEVWLWKSDASWHFVTVPEEVADEIEDMPVNRGGFGSVRVEVTSAQVPGKPLYSRAKRSGASFYR